MLDLRTALLVALVACKSGTPTDSDPESDTDTDADTDSDTDTDTDSDTDTDTDVTHTAVPGQACAPSERVAVVEVGARWSSPGVAVTAWDRPDPRLGAPVLSDGACAMYTHSYGCGGCSGGLVCTPADQCVDPQLPANDITLDVSWATGQASFGLVSDGQIYGTLPADAITGPVSVVFTRGSDRVAAGPSAIASADHAPSSVVFEGDFDLPGDVALSWSPPPDGGVIYTLTNINHHVPQDTFTECSVDAAAGALQIDASMTDPLAVSTGYEFQGIQHFHVAAAQIDDGCVEFRFEGPQTFL